MGLQTITCPCGSLFLLGMLQIVGFMDKRKKIVDNIFKTFFTAPDTESQWKKIQDVIQPHGTKKMLPTGAITSKPERQGDGGSTQFRINRAIFNLATMYKTAVEKDILIDEPGMACHFDPRTDPNQHMEGALKWNAIITAYETCYEMENTTRLMLEAIKPLYHNEETVTKTPAQLYFFADEFMHGSLIKPDSLVKVPWETIDQFKTDDLLNPGIIDVIFNFDVTKLWFIPVPTLSWGSGSATYPVDPEILFVTDPGAEGVAFDKSSSFSPDSINPECPPEPGAEPGDPAIPYPVATAATCDIVDDLYISGVWKTTIIPGVPGGCESAGFVPNDSGTISIAYQTLTVT